jgi:hypothetical protein
MYFGAEHHNICSRVIIVNCKGAAHRNIPNMNIFRCAAPLNGIIMLISTNISRLCRYCNCFKSYLTPSFYVLATCVKKNMLKTKSIITTVGTDAVFTAPGVVNARELELITIFAI